MIITFTAASSFAPPQPPADLDGMFTPRRGPPKMASIRRIFWEKGREKKAIFEAGSQATAGLAAPFQSLLTVVELRLEAAGCALAAISHLASQLSFPFFKRSRRSRAKSSRFGSTAKYGRTPDCDMWKVTGNTFATPTTCHGRTPHQRRDFNGGRPSIRSEEDSTMIQTLNMVGGRRVLAKGKSWQMLGSGISPHHVSISSYQAYLMYSGNRALKQTDRNLCSIELRCSNIAAQQAVE